MVSADEVLYLLIYFNRSFKTRFRARYKRNSRKVVLDDGVASPLTRALVLEPPSLIRLLE